MQYLSNWKSIQDVQINRALSEDRQQVHSPDGQQRSPPSLNYQPEGPIHGENDHIWFNQVACLKEYLQSNIQILQEQIDWNSHKTCIEKQSKEQGMSMTPTIKRDKSTGTNESLGDMPLSETPYCLHCDTRGHDIYQCSILGKREKINWLQKQDAILEGYRIQRQKRQMVTCLNC